VVKEDRLYLSWPNKESKLEDSAFVKESDGILSAKKAINELHRWLGEEGYTQVLRKICQRDVINCEGFNDPNRLIIRCVNSYCLP